MKQKIYVSARIVLKTVNKHEKITKAMGGGLFKGTNKQETKSTDCVLFWYELLKTIA